MNHKKIKFSGKEGQNWLLYWVGPQVIEGRRIKVKLYFQEVTDSNNFKLSKSFITKNRQFHWVPINQLYFFSLGTIFNHSGEIVKRAKDYLTEYFVWTPDSFSTKGLNIFPNYDSHFLLPSLEEVNQSGCITFDYFINIAGKSEKKKVIISSSVLLKYFYYFSNKMPELLSLNQLIENIELKSIRTIKTSNNKYVGTLTYNNNKFVKDEIVRLAKYFFMNDSAGIKSLSFISSNTCNDFLQSSIKQSKLHFLLPFTQRVKLNYYGIQTTIGEENCIIIYEISSISLNGSPLSVNEIVIKKQFERESTPKGNEKEFKGYIIPKFKKGGGNIEKTNIDDPGTGKAPIDNIGQSIHESNDWSNINIEINRRSDQQFNYGISGSKDIDINGDEITNVLNEIDNTSKSIRENYVSICVDIYRFHYINQLLLKLKEKNRNIEINFRFLAEKNQLYNTFYWKSEEILIAEIIYGCQHFYLFEFDSGATQFLSNSRFSEFSIVELTLFVNRYLEINKVKVSQLYLRKDNQIQKGIFKYASNIKIHTPIFHQEKEMKSVDYLIEHTEKKIMNRILNSK